MALLERSDAAQVAPSQRVVRVSIAGHCRKSPATRTEPRDRQRVGVLTNSCTLEVLTFAVRVLDLVRAPILPKFQRQISENRIGGSNDYLLAS